MNIDLIKQDIFNIEQLLQNIKKSLNLNEVALQSIIEPTKEKLKTKGAMSCILELIRCGFFDTYKTTQSVMSELKKQALTMYTKKNISMTLMRLIRKGILERSGLGSAKSPWNYIKIKTS